MQFKVLVTEDSKFNVMEPIDLQSVQHCIGNAEVTPVRRIDHHEDGTVTRICYLEITEREWWNLKWWLQRPLEAK